MSAHLTWSWTESLAEVDPDPHRAVLVERILFGLVRDRCAEIGMKEGQQIRCRSRTSRELTVELPNGGVHDLEVEYAWFIQVRPILGRPKEPAIH